MGAAGGAAAVYKPRIDRRPKTIPPTDTAEARNRCSAAIVTIGSEIVSGEISNRNGQWLAHELEKIGVHVEVIAGLPDDADRIAEFVEWARRAHHVVVVTGGLGVTPDDVTREGIARAFGIRRELHLDLARELDDAGGHMRTFADEWALMPANSRLLRTLSGGAPAFAVENVYVLAGQPEEMKATFGSLRAELPSGQPMAVWRQTFATTEDVVAPALERIALMFDDVAVGSYPNYGSNGADVEFVLRGGKLEHVEVAAAALESALADLGLAAGRSPRRSYRAPAPST